MSTKWQNRNYLPSYLKNTNFDNEAWTRVPLEKPGSPAEKFQHTEQKTQDCMD